MASWPAVRCNVAKKGWHQRISADQKLLLVPIAGETTQRHHTGSGTRKPLSAGCSSMGTASGFLVVALHSTALQTSELDTRATLHECVGDARAEAFLMPLLQRRSTSNFDGRSQGAAISRKIFFTFWCKCDCMSLPLPQPGSAGVLAPAAAPSRCVQKTAFVPNV